MGGEAYVEGRCTAGGVEAHGRSTSITDVRYGVFGGCE